MAESQKEKLMRKLNCSAEEAEDIIRTDKMIDRGERSPYDLDPEREKMAKKLDSITEQNWQMLPLHVEFQGAHIISQE